MNEGKSLSKLSENDYYVNCLLSLSGDKFASSQNSNKDDISFGLIKIWNIKQDKSIQIINIIELLNCEVCLDLKFFCNDFILIQQESRQFELWDIKTCEQVNSNEEDSEIYNIQILKNNERRAILTCTGDNVDIVNLWKIQE